MLRIRADEKDTTTVKKTGIRNAISKSKVVLLRMKEVAFANEDKIKKRCLPQCNPEMLYYLLYNIEMYFLI